MDLALVSVLVTLLNVILTMVLLLSLKRLTNDIPHLAHKLVASSLPPLMQEALNDVAPTIEEAISNGLSEGLKSVAGSVLAKKSAVSRQMKAAEKGLITGAVNEMVPGLGPVAAEYIQKYPFLMGFLQKAAQGQGSKNKGRSKM